jgi:quinol monooxygenase YgiN
MIIVAGWLRVAAEHRDAYLESCRAVVEAARATPGCVEFSVSADLLDAERVNVFEQWESTDAVERFRGSGPSDDQQAMILGAHVVQHEIASSTDLTGG